MAVFKSVDELVGNTPLLQLSDYCKKRKIKGNLFAKLECFNPAGSVKDRVAKQMLDTAEKEGLIKSGATIIEPTSGNTGIGLCAIAIKRGYRVIIVMPETMSVERQKLMRAYGAELVLTDGKKGMAGSIQKANELKAQIEGSFIPSQFTNPANAEAHFCTTGPEIYNDLKGEISAFVAGIGTGGSITGVGKYLKSKNENIEIIGVEPFDSPFLTQGKSAAHAIQGIGAGFKPEVLDLSVIDKMVTVTTEQAFECARDLAATEGILVGISAGAALFAAEMFAKQNKNTAVLLPDSGERYLSTTLFGE